MFKAKLIENNQYYSLKRKHMFLSLIPLVLIGFVVNIFHLPMYLSLLALIAYILIHVILYKNQKNINALNSKRVIEVDEKKINIRTTDGEIQETIAINQIDRIILKEEYSLPQETISDLKDEVLGDSKQNYLILHQGSKLRRLDFEVESYYMMGQLNKLVNNWKEKGYNII